MNIHAAHRISQERQADIQREMQWIRLGARPRASRRAKPGLIAQIVARLSSPHAERRVAPPALANGD